MQSQSVGVGRALRLARERRGLSLRQLAALVHFSPGHLSKVENGCKDPSPELAAACDRVLQVTPSIAELAAKVASARPSSGWRPPRLVPAQLPHPTTNFLCRDAELTTLHRAVSGRHDRGWSLPGLCLLTGGRHAGKTALAVHFAHQVAGRFTDGQLYLDLRGSRSPSGPLDVPTALAHLLHGLGVELDDIPQGTHDRIAMYRSLVAGRNLLLLLDNAERSDQVRPLLPGSGSSLALVTSRSRLRGLVLYEGATVIRVEYLTDSQSHRLLAELLGRGRLEREPDATRELISLLGGVPLAIRAAAIRISEAPAVPIARYVDAVRATSAEAEAAGDARPAITDDGGSFPLTRVR